MGNMALLPPTGNSLYIPVVNMPLPSATAAIPTSNNGWINSLSAATAAFTSVAANYPPSAANPPANGFQSSGPLQLDLRRFSLAASGYDLPCTGGHGDLQLEHDPDGSVLQRRAAYVCADGAL